MVSPVEAQSLSSLTSLFATPPTYPRNPTHEVREPLVLYIVRTPGSRDVFLTPLKPPTKASISLEAIQSCLYYLHVITPEDDEVRSSLEEQQRTDEAERLAKIPPIHRKPLPIAPFANYPASQRPPTPPKSYPHFQPGLNGRLDDTQVTRLAARGTHLRLHTRNVLDEVPVRRKPIGPRSIVKKLPDESPVAFSNPTGSYSNNQSRHYLRQPDHDEQEPWPSVDEGGGPALLSRTNLPSPTRKAVIKEADRIVLIRRDPSSGAQWNVGTITVASSSLSATVEIHTPGYQKFAKQELDHPSLDGTTPELSQDHDSTNSTTLVDHETTQPHFLRTIDIAALGQPRLGRSNHQRKASDDIYSPKEHIPAPFQALTNPRSIFNSPWQGHCLFTTGLDGRSLKCRHALPMPSSTGETSSESVCELRFNLPWLRVRRKHNHTQSEGENSPATRSIPRSAEAKDAFRRSVQRLRSGSGSKLLSATSEDEQLQKRFDDLKMRSNAADSQHRLDLSLGQEKAGGGFRGSSAKLGKLILENEGLKFADLVVGASMSIWWTQYCSDIEGG